MILKTALTKQEDLYRSGQPSSLNFPHLAQLGLKTIIFLAPDQPSQEFLNFVTDQEIEFLHLGSPHWNNHNASRQTSSKNVNNSQLGLISEELVLDALEIILERENYPILVMCNLGRHRTGTVIGCLRKLQRWNLTSILEEYRRYAGTKVRLQNEQFIELFDTDLVRLPSNPPQWL